MPRCEAKTKAGKKCQQWAMENGRCNRHGGKSLSGASHPNTKHGLTTDINKVAVPGGRKSTGLPRRFWDNLVEASEDPNLTSMMDELLIVDTRISDLIRRIDTGESGATWAELQKLVKEYFRSSVDDKVLVLEEIFRTIQTGASDSQTWDDINDAIERKGRIMAMESKRMKELNILIPSDRVLLLFRATVETVMRNVPDPDQQEIIRDSLQRLLNLPEVQLNRE